MTHSIEVWRAVMLDDELLPLLLPATEAELPSNDEGCDAIIELSRQFPCLSLEIAAYLAR